MKLNIVEWQSPPYSLFHECIHNIHLTWWSWQQVIKSSAPINLKNIRLMLIKLTSQPNDTSLSYTNFHLAFLDVYHFWRAALTCTVWRCSTRVYNSSCFLMGSAGSLFNTSPTGKMSCISNTKHRFGLEKYVFYYLFSSWQYNIKVQTDKWQKK